MAMQLAMLPPSYALLHDLRLPWSKGNVDTAESVLRSFG